MAEVPFRPVRQLSEFKGKGASANREDPIRILYIISTRVTKYPSLMHTLMQHTDTQSFLPTGAVQHMSKWPISVLTTEITTESSPVEKN